MRRFRSHARLWRRAILKASFAAAATGYVVTAAGIFTSVLLRADCIQCIPEQTTGHAVQFVCPYKVKMAQSRSRTCVTAREALTASPAASQLSSTLEVAGETVMTDREPFFMTHDEHQSRETLRRSLREKGFAVLGITSQEAANLQEAITFFESDETFRYPPVPPAPGANAPFQRPYRKAFDTLYSIGSRAAIAIFGSEHKILPEGLGGAAMPAEVKHGRGESLSAFEGKSKRPFGSSAAKDLPYNESFFNVFNYDNGCLNAHVDRGVLTLVYGSAFAPEGVSRLWIQNLDGHWLDAESLLREAPMEQLEEHRVLLWLGEEGVERLQSQGHTDFRAPLHSVRADPDGPYIEESHFRRDPEAAEQGNRRSIAMILDGHAPVSKPGGWAW